MNELQTLELLLDELLNGIQELLTSGETLSDEFQGVLAQELEKTVSRIDQLRAQSNEPPPIEQIEQEEAQAVQEVSGAPPEQPHAIPTGGKVPPLTEAMPSSNISAFSYNPQTQDLYVQFLGDYPNKEGSTYQYSGVPEQIFEIFRKGAIPARTQGKNKWGKWWKGKYPSIGSALYHLIKNSNYPYERIS